jgi:hypothetical protein
MDSMKRVLFLAAALPLLSACDPLKKELNARDLCQKGLDDLAYCRTILAKPALTPRDVEMVKDDLDMACIMLRIGLRDLRLPSIRLDSARYRRGLKDAQSALLDPRLLPVKPQ